MDRIWAPWRMDFILSNKDLGCPFCDLPRQGKERDGANFILHRGHSSFVMMNLYPYTNGHLLVLPYAHEGEFSKVSRQVHAEMGQLLAGSVELLKTALKAEGVNIGMNLGKVAGAGIEAHLHYHLVPRWVGDHNFMPVVANTRAIPEYIAQTCARLREVIIRCNPYSN